MSNGVLLSEGFIFFEILKLKTKENDRPHHVHDSLFKADTKTVLGLRFILVVPNFMLALHSTKSK